MSVNVFIQNEKLCLLIIRRLYNKMGLRSCSLKSLSCAVWTIKMFLHGEIETLCLCFEVIITDVEKKAIKITMLSWSLSTLTFYSCCCINNNLVLKQLIDDAL